MHFPGRGGGRVEQREEQMDGSALRARALSDYVRIHFAVEESLMRIHGYPEFAKHLDEHRAFAFDLHRMQEKSLKADVSEEMAATLGKCCMSTS